MFFREHAAQNRDHIGESLVCHAVRDGRPGNQRKLVA
jgi:hypothetical protein